MKKKWGIIDYLVIATIIIILLATSWKKKENGFFHLY